jgi:phosphatidylglycerol:prolipoprotein diacylglycerol transferase
MHPILIDLFGITIHTYGAMIAIGFLIAVALIRKLSQKDGLPVERMADFAFWALLVGFIGARTLFIFTRWESFMADPIAIFKVWEGGLVFYGGPLAVVPFSVWYFRKHRLPFWKGTDACIPALTVAHAFGRIGCFAAGCCYGKPTDGPLGVKFDSPLVDQALRGIPVHPTQLYEAGALFVLLVGLLWVHKTRKFDGQVFLTYLFAYPIIRSIIEAYRGDTIRGFVIDGWLSTSQFISVLVVIGACFAFAVRYKQLRRT